MKTIIATGKIEAGKKTVVETAPVSYNGEVVGRALVDAKTGLAEMVVDSKYEDMFGQETLKSYSIFKSISKES